MIAYTITEQQNNRKHYKWGDIINHFFHISEDPPFIVLFQNGKTRYGEFRRRKNGLSADIDYTIYCACFQVRFYTFLTDGYRSVLQLGCLIP